MEQGHLKIDVNYASKDELGSLSNSMRQMSDKISYYMDAISRVMRQLADSNLEIPHYDDFQGDFLPVQESLLIVLKDVYKRQLKSRSTALYSGCSAWM